MIAVGGNGNALRAGMMGTEQAGAGQMPMIWAGSQEASEQGLGDAAFRVYSSGHVDMGDVSITSSGGGGKVQIQNGQVSASNGNYNTVLSSDAMGGIDSAIKNSSTQTTKTVAQGSVSIALGQFETSNLQPVKMELVGTKTLWSHKTSKTASLAIPAFNIKFDFSDDGQIKGKRNNTWMKATFYLKLNVGDTVYNLATVRTEEIRLGETAKTITAAVPALNMEVPANCTVSMSVYGNMSDTLYPDEDYYDSQDDGTRDWYYAYDAATRNMLEYTIPTAFNCVITEGKYRNSYYADGFFLQGSSTRYFAANTFRDATVMQMRSGAALLKFTDAGLLQSLNGGATFYRANPLVCSFKLWYKEATSNGYWCEMQYNPRGWTKPTAQRESAGVVTITHSFNISNYVPRGQCYYNSANTYLRTIMFDNIGNKSFRIQIGTGNSKYDIQEAGNKGYVHIFIYDFTTY